LSNFPIGIFHEEGEIPRLPSLGVKLGIGKEDERQQNHNIKNAVQLFNALAKSTVRHADSEFLSSHPDYKYLLSFIDRTVVTSSWLNFSMPESDKAILFVEGVFRASLFLQKFEWKKYQHVRGQLLKIAESQLQFPPQENG